VLHQPEETFWKTATPARIEQIAGAAMPKKATQPEPKRSLLEYIQTGRG